jgi:thiamine biosynthesis lipoprotein
MQSGEDPGAFRTGAGEKAMRRAGWLGLLAALAAGLFFFAWPCGTGYEPTHEAQRNLMGTVFKIKAHGKDLSRGRFDAVSTEAFAEIARLEREMSEWLPESQISQAARFAGRKAVPVGEEILDVIDLSLSVSRQTGGVFDISFKPLGHLWKVEQRKEPPTDDEIRAALKFVDYRNIELDRESRTLFLRREGMAVGLGAVAKGYAAGRAARKMAGGGLRDFIIDAGGDLYFSGRKGREPWTTGIRDPEGKAEPLIRLRIRTDCAVVTSGDYERYFDYQGRRYHHIIDPRTGYPASGTRSATVFARDPAVADAYATSFFILGQEKAARIAGRVPGLAFILIDSRGKVWRSGGVSEFAEEIPR